MEKGERIIKVTLRPEKPPADGEEALYHGGLAVHLPVDRSIQLAADSAVDRWTWNVQKSVNRRMVYKLKLGKKYGMPDSVAAVKFDSLFSLHLKDIGKKTWKVLP